MEGRGRRAGGRGVAIMCKIDLRGLIFDGRWGGRGLVPQTSSLAKEHTCPASLNVQYHCGIKAFLIFCFEQRGGFSCKFKGLIVPTLHN